MKPIRFGVIGTVLQGIGLVTFILASRTDIVAAGKPIVIGLTLAGMACLLWRGVKEAKMALFLLPALLALGYAIAFHVVGTLAFRGLLRDMEFSADWADCLLSPLSVTAIVFALYVVGSALLYFVSKTLRARGGIVI